MKKDVIYIDIEDDITSVIERIKASSEKIIALVPPKGNAVLQSVVNLKLLKRAADKAGKQSVIVTNNHALTTLASSLDFYIAKNLQSKPVLMGESSAEEFEDEVEISDNVGELDEPGTTVSLAEDSDSDEVDLSEEELASLDSEDVTDEEESKKDKKKAKKSKNKGIPNFDTFRKKLLIGGGVALLLLIVGIAVFGRAKAEVVIRAETTPVDVAFEANLNANLADSDPANYNLKAVYQESKKSISQSFPATGEEDRGTKAGGDMRLQKECSPNIPSAVPAGTVVTASSLNFVTQSSASFSVDFIGGTCYFVANTKVLAQQNGDKFNLSARDYSVNGRSDLTGKGSQMTGGTSNIVKVVSQADVDKAREQINQQDTSAVKEELKQAMGEDVKIFEDSFTTSIGSVVSEPAVGQEANEGKLSAQVTYSLLGVSNKDLGAALDAFIVSKIPNKDQQRVYSNGSDDVQLEKISSTDKTAVYNISSLGQYGPQFDTEELKSNLAGKKVGEMRSYLQDLPGVKSVDINLSPFWARKSPNAERIEINLDVDKNSIGG